MPVTAGQAIEHSIASATNESWAGFAAYRVAAMSPSAALWGEGIVRYPSGLAKHLATTVNVHPLGCYFLRQCGVAFPGVVTVGDEVVEDEAISVKYVLDMAAKKPRPADVRRADKLIFAVDHGYRTYGHVIVDMLPRLMLAKAVLGKRFDQYSIFVPTDTPDWAVGMIKRVLSISDDQLLSFDWRAYRSTPEELVVPTLAHKGYHFHPEAKGIFDAIYGIATAKSSGGPTAIYVSRGEVQSKRQLTNREEIEGVAVDCGLTVVRPEAMPWTEQLALFSSAKLVVGEYGSALHNSIFSQTGCGVIALNPIQYLQSWLGALKSERTMYLYPPSRFDASGNFDWNYQHGPFSIDAAEFRAALTFAKADIGLV